MVQAIHDFDAVYPPQEQYRPHCRLPLVHQLIPPPTGRFGKESFNALRKKRPVVVTKKQRQSSSSASSEKSAVTALKRTAPGNSSGNVINIGNNEASRRVRRRLSLEHTLQ